MGWNKKYTWEFDLWGCVLGLLFLAPVLLWLAAPASAAALSEQNHGAILEAGTLILGLPVLFDSLSFKNRGYAGEKRELNWRDGFALACGCGYYAAWICYYSGKGRKPDPGGSADSSVYGGFWPLKWNREERACGCADLYDGQFLLWRHVDFLRPDFTAKGFREAARNGISGKIRD